MTDSTSSPIDLHAWLGSTLSSPTYASHLTALSSHASLLTPPQPSIKPYPDSVYLNYPSLGLSCLFAPFEGYEPPKSAQAVSELDGEQLRLESVDVYNPSAEPTAKGKGKLPAFEPFAGLPYTFIPRAGSPPRPPFPITRSTTGKEFVLALGEPARKGGGGGPKAGNIGIWCEWSEEGVMVEFEAGEASVVQNWEKGGDKVWRVMTLFERGKSVR
ncbi:hypothetical protein CALCODRAFT_484048 [Calocera cornea HHB12733]|uniref:Uncharacterized protein n=1 Tax=Calocera cornea HHB12733 TaxID=1353952 RepID=A0A165F886_9BASI|nr:hypothetical protein CALCODRAFT_484048 [Calocera cornea HHB12733]